MQDDEHREHVQFVLEDRNGLCSHESIGIIDVLRITDRAEESLQLGVDQPEAEGSILPLRWAFENEQFSVT
jgi:hypothetical protein